MRLLPLLALLAAPCLASALPTEPTKPMPRVSKGFLENKGQVVDQEHRPNTAVRYLWEGSGYNVQLRHTGFSYDHYQVEGKPREVGPDAPRLRPDTTAPEPVVMHMHRVDVELLGMNMGYGVETLDQLPGHFNFYTAGTPYGGATHVQHYGRVRYTEVYPGIDIEFVLDRERGFKYNVIARPGADLGAVRMRITGPTEQHVEQGEVVMQTRFGEVREAVPKSYWRTATGNEPVAVHFVDLGNYTYGLQAMDPAPGGATLVVDPQPQVLWATWFGGANYDTCRGMVALSNGGVFLWGETNSTGLGTVGTVQQTYGGSNFADDWLLVCFNATGGFEWATYIGGTEDDYPKAACQTDLVTVTAVGITYSPHIYSIDSTYNNDMQAVIVHLNVADGSSFGGALFGATNDDDGYLSIAPAVGGGYWVGGGTSIPNLGAPGTVDPVGPGGIIRRYSGLNTVLWSTYVPIMPMFLSCSPTGELWMAYTYNSVSEYGVLSSDGTSFQSWTVPNNGSPVVVTGIQAFSDTCVMLVGGSPSIPTTPNALIGAPLPSGINGYIMQVDTTGSVRYGTYWTNGIKYILPVPGGYAVAGVALPVQFPGMATPFCDTTGGALVTCFDLQHVRRWSAFMSDGSPFGFARDTLTGDYWFSAYFDEYIDSTAYQPTPNGGDEFSAMRFRVCESNNLPALGPITGPGSALCGNVTQSYSVAPVPGVNYYFWQPPPNGTVVAGQGTTTAQIITGATVGMVRVMAMDSCGIGPVSVLPIAAPVPAQVSIAPAGQVPICTGDSVQLVATSNGTVLWSNGATGLSTWVSTPGSYTATATSTSGCTATSQTAVVSYVPLVPFNITGPTVVSLDDTTTYSVASSSSYIAQEWEPLGNATIVGDSTLLSVDVHWLATGMQQLMIHRTRNLAQCVFTDTLAVQVNNTIGIQEQALVPLQVYPNPANTHITLVPAGTWRPGMRYTVLNALGQEVLSGALPASGGQPVELSTRALSAGVYTLQTSVQGRTDAVVRVVVER